jgi:hypothetical protein
MPATPVLVELAIALPLALFVAYLIARTLRWMFGARLSLRLSTMVIISVLGLSAGMLVSGWFLPDQRVWSLATVALAFGSSLLITVVAAAVTAVVLRGREEVDVADVLAAGESDRVEFKETARWNVREERKDPRMEVAIAKSVAAFLNSGGGTLVIGANDRGEAIGLDRDLATLRTPDHDRFELWLRDLLSHGLGHDAAALPRIRFPEAPNGVVVCVVACPAAERPVFLSQTKEGKSTDLWVRVGNSTRSLEVDQAVAYVARHWRPSLSTVLLGRSLER